MALADGSRRLPRGYRHGGERDVRRHRYARRPNEGPETRRARAPGRAARARPVRAGQRREPASGAAPGSARRREVHLWDIGLAERPLLGGRSSRSRRTRTRPQLGPTGREPARVATTWACLKTVPAGHVMASAGAEPVVTTTSQAPGCLGRRPGRRVVARPPRCPGFCTISRSSPGGRPRRDRRTRSSCRGSSYPVEGAQASRSPSSTRPSCRSGPSGTSAHGGTGPSVSTRTLVGPGHRRCLVSPGRDPTSPATGSGCSSKSVADET